MVYYMLPLNVIQLLCPAFAVAELLSVLEISDWPRHREAQVDRQKTHRILKKNVFLLYSTVSGA